MMGGIGMGFGMTFMVLFWVFLIVGAVWAARAMFGNSQPRQGNHSPQTPREILDQRYARGEITREQYEVMKQDIV